MDAFPPTDEALQSPNGLLAAGGDLSTERLLTAYRHGIFPWYEAPQPVLWWTPDPRAVLFPEDLHISRSLRKTLRANALHLSVDRQFTEVMRACADLRQDGGGTWIDEDMLAAYGRLHTMGYAHSVEVSDDKGALVGGLYGVALGRVFFGESMFSRRTDASKVALVHLAARLRAGGYRLLDTQFVTPHLATLGAIAVPRTAYRAMLQAAVEARGDFFAWPRHARAAGKDVLASFALQRDTAR